MEYDTRKPSAPYDILLLTAGFLVLLMFGLRTISGADIWLHLAAGRNAVYNGASSIDPFSFSLPPGTAWIQTTWLYDIMVYKLWLVGGSAIIILLHAAAVVGGFLLLLPVSRKYSGQAHQAIALLICCWLLAPLFTVRPIIFCLFYIALFINLLNRPRVNIVAITALIISQILWANMHITFILGICLALVRTWEAFSQQNKEVEVEARITPPLHFAILSVALAGVSLINPYGAGLFKKAIATITQPESGVILEWISTFYRDFLPVSTGFITTLTLILIAAVFIFYRGRLPAIPTFCAILSAFLLVRSNLSVELCALLAFPFMAISLSTIAEFMSHIRSERTRQLVSKGLLTICALCMVFSAWMVMTNRYYVNTGSAAAFGFGVNTDAFPVGALKYIREKHELPKRTLNISNDGGYMLWQQPDEKVFSDPRGDLYGGLFFQNLAKGLRGDSMLWNDLIKRYDPEGILLNTTVTDTDAIIFHLLSSGDWFVVYFDGTTVLLASTTESNRALIEDHELRKRGAELLSDAVARYTRNLNNAFIRPPNPSRIIGASSFFHAHLNKENNALLLTKVYEIDKLLTEGTPNMLTAWKRRGFAEFHLDKTEDSIRSFEHYLELARSDASVLMWLSEAYIKTGRASDAAMAVEKARRINPKLVADFEKSRDARILKSPE